MPEWQQVKAYLTPAMQMTTRQLAAHFGYSIGHTSRVMRWMDKQGHAALVPGSSPFRWTGI